MLLERKEFIFNIVFFFRTILEEKCRWRVQLGRKQQGGGGWEGILFLYDVRGGLAIFLTAADISEGKIARMAILAVTAAWMPH